MKPHILIADDDENIRTQMKWALAEDYHVLLAEDRLTALETLGGEDVPVVLLDLGLPPQPNDTEEGFQALQDILTQKPHCKVIVITGQGEKENAMRAVGAGAYDFLAKPIDTDQLKIILGRACYLANLEKEYAEVQRQVQGDAFEGMLGTSPPIQQVFAAIRKVATTDAPVLLLGESGTGKEMAAQAIHNLSDRHEGPFIAINCSAIPETLLESELFGHEKGSFTGAHAQRKGRIESAAGGTLFLDEIGDLPSALQVKLLRFLQEQRIERVGGRTEIDIDTRIIAATNTDLKKAMEENRFREDLYYRLAVVVLRLPPLRDRQGDVALLAKAFLKRFSLQHNENVTGFSQKALRAMDMHDWPGNIRELENRIKRAVIMVEGRLIKPVDLEMDVESGMYAGVTLKEARDNLDREMAQRALTRNKGNISRAASDLGISRPTFYELMERLNIEKP